MNKKVLIGFSYIIVLAALMCLLAGMVSATNCWEYDTNQISCEGATTTLHEPCSTSNICTSITLIPPMFNINVNWEDYIKLKSYSGL